MQVEYETRLAARKRSRNAAESRHRRLAGFRLLVFALAGGIAWLAFARGAISGWWLAVAPLLFAALVYLQSRAAADRRFAERAIRYYEQGLARLDHTWMGKGETGERFRDPTHPYAEDLDLFGTGSLFELLSTSRTRSGEAQLARWLLHPADREEVLLRQGAIEELRTRTDLREDLAVLGEDFRTGVEPEALAAWGAAGRIEFSPGTQRAAAALSLLAAALIVIFFASNFASAPVRIALLIVAAIEGLLALPLRGKIAQVVNSVEQPGHDLDLLAQVLARFERERFRSPKLAALRRELDVQGKPASGRIAQLERLIDLLHSRDNVIVRAFGPLVLWTTQVAFAIERWRAVSGAAVGRWLHAIGELEALCALSGYAYEHPDDPFPELLEGEAFLRGTALGHPLLPADACVRNDAALSSTGPNLVVISGSNMSGKSTYLRTVGVNAVMALAGASVRAREMTISQLRIGASIRVSDSLQGGTSRFYAEITRLRDIVALAGEGPVLFLLDELLNGTNSRDRGIGAAGVARGLLQRGAIGFITTHDLALTSIAEINRHFEDHIEAGVVTFDYKIRDGVVKNSNALELMRAIGLEV
ncbi:MAG: DNA mismatch repair protein MutS [Acidobacteriota bacterium]|nr:DNA mismatch repair protein MutS [Acidobacteriota bacterium]